MLKPIRGVRRGARKRRNVSRRPDPERKPQLLSDIVDYLHERSLSSLTFRTLADHLDVSTFTLVYHFGTKSQLVAEVIGSICELQRAAFLDAQMSTDSIDEYFDAFRRYWAWTLDHRALHRLEFEAAMLEAARMDAQSITRTNLLGWHDIAEQGMRALGVPGDVVPAEARAMANTVYGLQYDLIVLDDPASVTEAFERALESSRRRVHALVGTVSSASGG